MTRLFGWALVCAALACSPSTAGDVDEQTAFFARLKNLCGARFEGRSTFPADPGDDFRDKTLVAVFESCDSGQVRIPFRVGDNTSRTWIVTRHDDGLQLKHDHRHADGTPDEITMYGGTARTAGTARRQSFPADAHTAELIPAAATNEWFLTLSEDGRELTYALERHGKPRFSATLRRVDDRDHGLDRYLIGELAGLERLDTPVSLAALGITFPDGSERLLSEKAGTVLLVNLWSRGCAPCKDEMPDFAALQHDLGDERFEVVALPMDTKKLSAVRKVLKSWGASNLTPYRNDPRQLARVLHDGGLFSERRISFVYPTTYVVNKRGEIIAVRQGFQHWDTPETRALIQALKDDEL